MIITTKQKVELLPNPIGMDLEIQKIQEKLARLSWLEIVFGRATKQISEAPSKEPNTLPRNKYPIYPEVYYKREPKSLMINDNFKSYCFFHAVDPLIFPAFSHFDLSASVTQPVDIIFWMNLQKINSSKKYNFVEELRFDVLKVLKSCPQFTPIQSFIEYDKVFIPFTITDTFVQYLKPPYAGFKIAGELNYDYLNC